MNDNQPKHDNEKDADKNELSGEVEGSQNHTTVTEGTSQCVGTDETDFTKTSEKEKVLSQP